MNQNKRYKVAFCTLGCKVNQYETDAMMEIFKDHDFEIVEFNEASDVYIINTCTVTNMADRKSRQMLHRAKKKNPNSIVVAAGCYVQAAGEKLLEDSLIDIIVGNNQKKEIYNIVSKKLTSNEMENNQCLPDQMQYVIDINHTSEYENLAISSVSEHTRAYIKIQDGCNQFCSYCIIPFARGRVRSRQMSDILDEIKLLAKKGYKEVVLTGIHISSYGLDFDGENYNENPKNGCHLLELIENIAKISGIERIRLGSLEPQIVTDIFAKKLADIDKVCAHFHLSLQSGCNETLLRMNRHYTAEEYEQSCHVLRKYFDHPALTTDVIVGFPGETDEEFEKCKAFLEKIEFAQMHIFKYSKRQGTKAAQMKNQVDESIKNKRSDILLELNQKLEDKYQGCWNNKPMKVLLEEAITLNNETYMTGHTCEYIRVIVPESAGEENQIIEVCSTGERIEEFLICKRMD